MEWLEKAKCLLCKQQIGKRNKEYSQTLDEYFHLVCIHNHFKYCNNKDCMCKDLLKEFGVRT